MGNCNTNELDSKEIYYSDNYILSATHHDKRYGDVKVYKSKIKDNELIWNYEMMMSNQEELEFFKSYIYNNNHLITVFVTKETWIFSPDKSCKSCTDGPIVKVVMDYHQRDLESEIIRKQRTNVTATSLTL